jgi:glutamyl-Q tRNA(Asp) synthetase
VLLGLDAPIYHHHHLVTDATGRKLSKSAKDTSLRSLRQRGYAPADIRRMVTRT